ncbi:SgcJ/EcaC family oxidoreductase [Nocardia yamanashiensis]|uniref:SgcJ/EcaC family oxidoreductase n=1 Tax=Nocardia yamanashiensis TaxID=209247 RepID=UPI001E4000ED|nr:SgcJ/EcaC family oxidoreductase [Nocardia yamanashiensis]UGT40226.1 SgcJ/EcaC family oxidoreductase [Nocardia yamanashiensis]
MTTPQITDEAAVRALFEHVNQAWADGDAHAYAQAFTADADYVTWMGTHTRGREAIEATHAPLFAKYLKGTHLDGEITSVRFLAPDVAVVHGRGAVVKGRKRRGRFNTKVTVFVAVRRDGEWLFDVFHNTKHHYLLETLTAKFDSGSGGSVTGH